MLVLLFFYLLIIQNIEKSPDIGEELVGLPVLDILAYDEEVRLDEAFDDLTVPLLT